jgi:hypothetical protein
MTRRNTAWLGLCLTAAIVAAGCGSSGSDNSTSTVSLSKAEWIAKADAICKAGNTTTNAAAKQKFGNQRPSAADIQQFTADTVLPNIAQEIDQIKALGTPSEQGAQADAVVNSAESSVNAAKANPSLLNQKNGPFEQTNKLAQAYGMKVCGQD